MMWSELDISHDLKHINVEIINDWHVLRLKYILIF